MAQRPLLPAAVLLAAAGCGGLDARSQTAGSDTTTATPSVSSSGLITMSGSISTRTASSSVSATAIGCVPGVVCADGCDPPIYSCQAIALALSCHACLGVDAGGIVGRVCQVCAGEDASIDVDGAPLGETSDGAVCMPGETVCGDCGGGTICVAGFCPLCPR